MSTTKLVTDQLRAELQPELDALAKHHYERGLAAAGGNGQANVLHDAAAMARKATQIQGAAAAVGVKLTNEEAVKQAYEESGIPL